jgi:2-polyprenyl-3-methyl-5-hydroxy-6-metoxy-1,4-benzoquinol methylase
VVDKKMIKIIIRGQPNTGKTTLAKKLHEMFPNSTLIETDWKQVKLIRTGHLPRPKDYSQKLGQILDDLTEQQKKLLKDSIVEKIKAAGTDIVIVEGYALTLPDYADIADETDIIIDKVAVSNNRIPEVVKAVHERGMSMVKAVMPRLYQRFEFTGGASDSDSIKKLQSLALPNFIGKRVLDVGCNTGFFTFQSSFLGASEVVGIDNAELAIRVAKTLQNTHYLTHNTKFQVLDVNQAETLGKFDLILCLSMLHYLSNQDEIIKKLYSMLNPGGVLKLEMGINVITTEINGKFYPSLEHVQSLFPDSITISPSVNQAGDAIPRHVITAVK